METLVGTVLMVAICLIIFPEPEVKVNIESPVNTKEKVTCTERNKRLYKSYNLEEPSKDTLVMLCGGFIADDS